MESVPSSLKSTTAAEERQQLARAGVGGGVDWGGIGGGFAGGGGETPAIPGRAPGATGEITVFEETDRIWRKTKA